ncbi:class I SAM-dependent methyltransferase [Lactobacillus sp. S2-2]|uniref:class I SAM-dependent methyltransferase n=1 Tax=Lactobacillus sp. S2-2 TaxID=2692917 RepID=UPI00351CD745
MFDQSSEVLKNELETSYLDAFIETAENLINNDVRVENDKPSSKIVDELKSLYKKISYKNLEKENIRKSIQMAMLKAIKEDKIQSNHQITPDSIAYLIAILVDNFINKIGKDEISILDLSIGSGNLLFALFNQIDKNKKIDLTGIDNDDSLISVGSISSEMQDIDIDLIHQDATSQILKNKFDLVISDLPVGYYPIDENIQNYVTKSDQGHSYVHHLLIEQAINKLNDGGFGLFLVPSNLFETQESKKLLSFIQDNAYLQSIINLPSDLFMNKSARKSLIILQKHGNSSKQVKKVMLGELPSFKEVKQVKKFISQLVKWESNDLLR